MIPWLDEDQPPMWPKGFAVQRNALSLAAVWARRFGTRFRVTRCAGSGRWLVYPTPASAPSSMEDASRVSADARRQEFGEFAGVLQ